MQSPHRAGCKFFASTPTAGATTGRLLRVALVDHLQQFAVILLQQLSPRLLDRLVFLLMIASKCARYGAELMARVCHLCVDLGHTRVHGRAPTLKQLVLEPSAINLRHGRRHQGVGLSMKHPRLVPRPAATDRVTCRQGVHVLQIRRRQVLPAGFAQVFTDHRAMVSEAIDGTALGASTARMIAPCLLTL